jgi:hypothetical protein
MEIKGEWNDSLIWCPSQCYLPLEYKGKKFQLYLRWRWDDPWTADLIEAGETEEDKEVWHDLRIGYHTDEQLDNCKFDALKKAEEKLIELYG